MNKPILSGWPRIVMNFADMKAPFPASDIEWRVQQAGEKNGRVWAMCLAYVTARAIQDRLDDVCGPENWKNQFLPGVDGGVLCGISIRIGDEWITKWDGAENTDIESVKGGLSGATKRAAVQWGIGRYLYHLEEGWANVNENGKYRAKTKEGKWFKWDPPQLPEWALPSQKREDAPQSQSDTQSGSAGRDDGARHAAGVAACRKAAGDDRALSAYVAVEYGYETVDDLSVDELKTLYKAIQGGALAKT